MSRPVCPLPVACRPAFRAAAALALLLAAAPAAAQGFLPDPDPVYRSIPEQPRYRAFLPPEVDLSGGFPAPGNQGDQASCTAWAVGYAVRSYYEQERRNWSVATSDHQFSPAYIYNALVAPSGDCEAPTSMSAALDLVRRTGVPSLADFPYDQHDCTRRPSQRELATAALFRIEGWQRLRPDQPDDIKGALYSGHPVIFGMGVSANFKYLRPDTVYDDVTSPTRINHAMVLVGYSDRLQAFKLVNSWGRTWSSHGFGWVSYDAFSQRVHQAYIVRMPSAIPPLPGPEPAPAPVMPLTPPVIAPAIAPAIAGVTPAAKPVVRPPVQPVAVRPNAVPATPVSPVPVARPATPKPLPAEQPVTLPPADPPDTEDLRRTLAERLNGLSCSGLTAEIGAPSPDTGRAVTLRGYTGAQADRDLLQRDIAALPGVASVRDLSSVRPWPQCETLQTFAPALDQPRGLALTLKGPDDLADGDSLGFEVRTPAFPAYLYVVYLQAGGDAVYLEQPRGAVPNPLPAGSRIAFGTGGPGQPAFRVSPPFGREMVVAVAAASPLFPAGRPDHETERDFLTAFRGAFLAKPNPGAAGRIVAAAVAPVTTHAQTTHTPAPP